MNVFLTSLAIAGGLVAVGAIVRGSWKLARFLVRLADELFGDPTSNPPRPGLGQRVAAVEQTQKTTNARLDTTNARIDDLTRVVMDGR